MMDYAALARAGVLSAVVLIAFSIYLVYFDTISKLFIAGAVVVSLVKSRFDWKAIEEARQFILDDAELDEQSDMALAGYMYIAVCSILILCIFLSMLISNIGFEATYISTGAYYLTLIYVLYFADKNVLRSAMRRYIHLDDNDVAK